MVVISYPDAHQEETLLADVPQVGDRIRLAANGAVLIVLARTWVEGTSRSPEPSVVVTVRPADK
jgi:hypothetical protein